MLWNSKINRSTPQNWYFCHKSLYLSQATVTEYWKICLTSMYIRGLYTHALHTTHRGSWAWAAKLLRGWFHHVSNEHHVRTPTKVHSFRNYCSLFRELHHFLSETVPLQYNKTPRFRFIQTILTETISYFTIILCLINSSSHRVWVFSKHTIYHPLHFILVLIILTI